MILGFGDVDVLLLWWYIDKVDYEGGGFYVGKLFDGLGFYNFNYIWLYDYFDFMMCFLFMLNFEFMMGINNLFNVKLLIVGSIVGMMLFNSGNIYLLMYDMFGWVYVVLVKVCF